MKIDESKNLNRIFEEILNKSTSHGDIIEWYSSHADNDDEKKFAEFLTNEQATFKGFYDLLKKPHVSYEELADYLGLRTFWELEVENDDEVWAKLYLGCYEKGLMTFSEMFETIHS